MNTQPNHTLRARLIRIEPPSPDWWDLHKQSTFVYQTDTGEEHISADYVPIDCREVGKEYELVYTYFSIGNAEGMHFEPRPFYGTRCKCGNPMSGNTPMCSECITDKKDMLGW